MAVLTCIQEVPDFSFRWVTWLPAMTEVFMAFLSLTQQVPGFCHILPDWPQLSASQLTLYSLSYWLCHLSEVQTDKFKWNCFYFQAANQEEIINILQDSVNIAQKEQQDLQQKLKDAVSSYRSSTLGTVLQMSCVLNLLLNLFLFQEAGKEKLLNTLQEERKKVIYIVVFIHNRTLFSSKDMKLQWLHAPGRCG